MRLIRRLLNWAEAHPARAAVLAGWYQQGFSILGSVVAIPFIFKLLGKSDAGLWFSLQGVLAMLGMADFGFGLAITRQAAYSVSLDETKALTKTPDLIQTQPGWAGVSEVYAASRVIFWRATATTAIAMVLLYHGVLVHTKLVPNDDLRTGLVWYALGGSILFNLQTRLSQCFLDGLGFMFLSRLISGTYNLLWNIASVIALLLAPGLLGMSVAVLGASAIQFGAMHLGMVRFSAAGFDFKRPPCRRIVSRLFKVALPFGFVNSVGVGVAVAQVPVLGSILGPAAVPPYYLAFRISQTLHSMVQQITTTQMPLFTRECGAGNAEAAKGRMSKTIILGGALYIASSLFFCIGSPLLVRLWVGPGQYIGTSVLLLVAINFFLAGIAVIPSHLVMASGTNPFALPTLIQGVLTIFALVALCPVIGIAAVPSSSLIGGLVTNYWYAVFKAYQTWRSLARPSQSVTGPRCQ